MFHARIKYNVITATILSSNNLFGEVFSGKTRLLSTHTFSTWTRTRYYYIDRRPINVVQAGVINFRIA